MNFTTNKEKRNSGLGIVIAYFSVNGYTVSIPLNDTQDYDLVIEKSGKLESLQVKATGCKRKNGNYQVSLRSCGGTKGRAYKTLLDTNVDYLFILNQNKEIYLIPKSEIRNRNTLNLCKKYEQYRIFF